MFYRAAGFEVPLASQSMKLLLTFFVWCVLFVLCWPLAVLALVLFPLVWLLLIPFRLAGIAVRASLALVKAILFLPARLLGQKPGA